jgi:hypothetical protein
MKETECDAFLVADGRSLQMVTGWKNTVTLDTMLACVQNTTEYVQVRV